jgi:alpha-tubulin suppressor-like RCC1 family protein
MALVNQQSLINGVGPVGFANPVLYAIGRTKGSRADVYRYAFNDITTGYSNLATNCSRDLNGNCSCDFAQAGGQYVPGYSAGNGYDLASGLGTPRFGLIQQLASSTPSPVLDVSAGMFLTCAVKSDHSVWCWGLNDQGQLGNGTITSGSLLPVKVTGISVAQSVSASEASACALLLDRSVQCWGSNDHGELGNGTTTGSSVPVPVSGITNATAVSAGGFGACALLSDGSVYCWGYNNDGQLGNGTTTDSSVPVAVSGLSAASGIAAGSSHSCAVLSDGTARCWGNNDTGQLGNGTTVNANVPTAVSGITNARQISAAAGYACAALGNGTIQCWGQNLDGTLGNGRTDDFVSVVPVNVANITTAVSVSSGTFNACALLSDGSVQCWGANESGELGNGLGGILSGYPSGVPVTASLTQPVVGISSGAWYSCARSNGAVSCWGSNFGGVLGDGSTVNRYVPGSVHFW